MRFPKSSLLAALGLCAASEAKQCTRGQLFLLDHEQPRVAIYDLDSWSRFTADPTYIEFVHQTSPAWRFAYTSGSNLIVAVSNLATTTYPATYAHADKLGGTIFVDTGVRKADDMTSVTKKGPKKLDYHFDCVFPGHPSTHGMKMAQFCDGGPNGNASIWVLDENLLAEYTEGGSAPTPLLYPETPEEGMLEGWHHGLAALMGEEDLLVTQTGFDGEFTSGVTGMHIVDYETGNLEHNLNDPNDAARSCGSLHGDAHLGNTFAFGCSAEHGGILVVTSEGGSPEYHSRLLKYPVELQQYEYRAGFIKSHPANSHFVAVPSCCTEDVVPPIIAFDPVRDEAQLKSEHMQYLAGKHCAGDYGYEQSAGKLFLIWLETGVLQVFAVNPWVLVSEIQVEEDMEECGLSTMAVGHGYAYIHVNRTLHEVDIRDSSAISVKSYPTEIQSHNGVGIMVDVVAGVPHGLECDGPDIPYGPPASRGYEDGFVKLCFHRTDLDEAHHLVPGSAFLDYFLLKLRNDIGRTLNVGIDRIYVKEFRHIPCHDDHEEEDFSVQLLFVDHGAHDVNGDSGTELKNKFADLVANKDSVPLAGETLALVEGQVTDEAPDAHDHAEDHAENSDDADEWPTSAKVAVSVTAVLLFFAIIAVFVYHRKTQKALLEKEQAIREAEEASKEDFPEQYPTRESESSQEELA